MYLFSNKITVKAQSCYCEIDDFFVVGGRIISNKLFSVIHEAVINYYKIFHVLTCHENTSPEYLAIFQNILTMWMDLMNII